MLTGEYSLKDGKATAFVAVRDTPEQAQAEAKRYLDFLAANGYQKVQAPGAPGDIAVLGLDNSFEMVFVEGRTLAGVHDATIACRRPGTRRQIADRAQGEAVKQPTDEEQDIKPPS